MHYFAYGSNMCRQRLEARLGPCAYVTIAWTDGFALRFHKDGRDGSGKCDAYRTGRPADRVFGVIFDVDAGRKPILDRIEGEGYQSTEIALQSPQGELRAWTYLARRHACRAGSLPFHWYKSLVLEGARQHRLPESYVRLIRAVESRSDPDVERAARNLALLAMSAAPHASDPAA